MSVSAYRTARRQLLAASSWNRWAAKRGYSETAGEARRRNQAEMARLRAARQGLRAAAVA